MKQNEAADPRRVPSAIAAAIRDARRIALCCHINPDGDTIGSALALRLGLEALGKECAVVCQDKVPDQLRFLAGAERIEGLAALRGAAPFDLGMPVDVSEAYRLGKEGTDAAWSLLRARSRLTAQIDHHMGNPAYCDVNEVDGHAAATGVLVFELLGLLGVTVTREIAECLYAAVSTDTGNFQHGNTNAEVFRVMAELMEAGLDVASVSRRLFTERSMAQQLLIARAMAGLRYIAQNRIGVMSLSQADFAAAGALPEHADTIVNMGLRASGVKMSLLAREDASGIKCSLRSVEPVCVDAVARRFGGGGHAQAAGCTLQGELAQVTEQVAAAMREALAEQLSTAE